MQITSASSHQPLTSAAAPAKPSELRSAFDRFVGETFYGQMIASLRKTTSKPAYFHGGRAEEVFQSQFDQTVAQQLAASNAHSFTGPMFKQFEAQTNPVVPTESETPPWEGLLAAGRR